MLTGNFAGAITIWPFIIIRNAHYLNDKILINHEKIHLRQQLEMLIIFFYLWYGIEFLVNYSRGMPARQAYRHIRFEREAYLFERDPAYLENRKLFAWLRNSI